MLNTGQKKAKTEITRWWVDPAHPLAIDAKAGTGKTYLANEVVQGLSRCFPIFLAPTNEALNQLRSKTEGDYLFKTVHSALGIIPTTSSRELKFKHIKLPPLWEEVNLAIIDEASMLDEDSLALLDSTGVPILFMGHSSQLPSVDRKRKRVDPCLSPVFQKGYKTLTLTEPMRHTGPLWEFANLCEKAIYDPTITLPKDYNITNKGFRLALDTSLEEFLEGTTKVVAWRNKTVDKVNKDIRSKLFGSSSKNEFIKGDRLILTKPVNAVPLLHTMSKRLLEKRNFPDFGLFSNTKATVLAVESLTINLDPLSLPCYKLTVIVDNKEEQIHVLKKDGKDLVAAMYERHAWAGRTSEDKAKRFKLRHKVLSYFAEVKHFYCATAHRLQGSSVQNIITLKSDIASNPCIVEALKCQYVANSRCIKSLQIYGGHI